MISGYISIYQVAMSSFGEKFSIFVGYLSLVLCASVLLMIKYQTNNTKLIFEGGEIDRMQNWKSYWTLWERIKQAWSSIIPKLNVRPSTMEYYLYFFIRRTLYVSIIFAYNENTQMTLLLLLNCFSFMYLGHRKPFTQSLNRREVF